MKESLETKAEVKTEGPTDAEIVEKLKEFLSADDIDFQTVTGKNLQSE